MLTLPNYQIGHQIYESVNSLVYRGLRKKDNKPIILKMLKENYPTPTELTRYRQEYEIIHHFELSGVIKVYALEKYQNTLVIILEDFGGESLKELITNQTFFVNDFLHFAIQLADTLGKIHTANIIHKDINPSNILVNPQTKQLKIIDFGIASRLPRENPILKNPEQLEGTLAYLSPEQTGRINRSIDYRTDLYSLGVTLYELFTGQLPFIIADAMELVHCHIAKTPPPISQINSDIPPVIAKLIMKLMAKNAEDRYQSAFGVKFDLEKCLENLQAFGNLQAISFELAQNDASFKLSIPQKLYGRDNEIKTLLQTFQRVSEGTAEMMLLAGYSGVGKSALIRQVHKPMTEKRGYFAAGKFDQFQKNMPYYAITQAFNQFCHYLLMESTKKLANWQNKILDAVGHNGQIIIDVIPDLELIIGEQPKIAKVGATETQNRFQMFFLNFVKALCHKEHPFILFIDDLQWIDSASLALLKSIMLDDEIQYLLILGAYRDNEVDSTHPFIRARNELQKADIIINTIELANLQESDINHLLQDSLLCEAKQSQKLANLVYQKTRGNAFFTRQFLQSLYREHLLHFDFHKYQWQWDIEQIKSQNMTDNVIDLMLEQLKKLPEATQQVLRLAACVGNHFDLQTLAIIHEQSQWATIQDLSAATQAELLLPTSELEIIEEDTQLAAFHYQFLHDRVQQAAYALIDEPQKKAVHLKIGRLLLSNASENEREENLFNIANQFNKGIALIEEQTDKLALAEINLKAAQKARQSMASQTALEYLKKAISLLPEKAWQNEYPLTLKLYKERAEAEFLNAHYQEAEKFIKEVVKEAKSVPDKVEVYYLLITLHGVKGDFNQAIETGRVALSLFGIILPNEAEKERVSLEEMEKARTNLQGIKPDSILNWPNLNDPTSIMIIKLMVVLEPSVYIIGDLSTYIYLVSAAINLSVQHKGLVAEISKMYTNYGFLIGDIYGDYVSSYEFGAVALKIAERYNSGAYLCKTSLLFGSWINPWCRPLYQAADIHTKGYQAGIESGEYEFAGYNVYGYLNNLFTQGKNLNQLKAEIKLYLPSVEKINHQFAAYFSLGMAYVINLLQGEKSTLNVFGQEMPLKKMLLIAEENQMGTILCPYYTAMGFAHYLLGNLKEAILQIANAEKHLNGVFGSTTYPEFFFQQALVITGLLPTLDPPEKQAYQIKLDDSLDKLTTWAKNCCQDNFEHKFLLIKAENSRIKGGNDLEIMQLYEKAILSARNSGFIQNEALCNELAAKFYLERQLETNARSYMSQAYYTYQQWDATAKIKALKENYPQLLSIQRSKTLESTITNQTTLTTSTKTQLTTSMMFDLDSVTKAFQTLACEIVLSKLLKKIMQIMIENAGAERGLFILEKEKGQSEWVIEAEGALNIDKVTVLQSLPIEKALPLSIINYVIRTREPIVLANAMQEGIYTEDSYIQQHQLKSILCHPILHQGQLIGVLYLENNLTEGTFTPARLKIVDMLSSQAAISLENALLYHTLEEKVAERTTQLAKANKKITRAHQEILQLNQLLEEENLRMSTELEVAKHLQQMVLPKEAELQQIENLEIAGFMEAADEVGGDYYEVLSHDGHIKIGIGDVTGHGLESGVLMLMVQTTVRALLLAGITNPERFLNVLNRTVYYNTQRMESDKNLTLSLLDYKNGNLCLTGQHEDVLVVRQGGKIERIDTVDLGFMVGVMPDMLHTLSHRDIQLQTGDCIVLYTDGITEARNPKMQLYGMERLCQVITQSWHLSAQEIQQAIIANVKQYIGTQKVFDDITVLILKQK